MNIVYDVPVPKHIIPGRPNMFRDFLEEFEASSHSVACITFDTKTEAKKARDRIAITTHRWGLNCVATLRGESVYVIKGGEK